MSVDPYRGAVSIVGVGDTPFYKRGTAPESELDLLVRAIESASADAGIDVRDIDGFASYGADLNSGCHLAGYLGVHQLNWTSMAWGGGGGGSCGAIALAAAAIVSGQARMVAVYRASAENTSGRLLQAVNQHYFDEHYEAHGQNTAVQKLAMATRRLIEVDGVSPLAMKAFSQVCYRHAQNNPRASGYGTILDDETYYASRMIAEPIRLFDCSRENDGAGCILVTSTELARTLVEKPIPILSAVWGVGEGDGHLKENHAHFSLGGQVKLAEMLWRQAGLAPRDVDVAQVYANMSGPAVSSIIDHGFCTAEESGERLTVENLSAPGGWLPINTSGGDLAEGFIHGMGNIIEGARQLRGQSVNPVPGAQVCLVTGGPIAEALLSSALIGTIDTL